MKVRPLKDFQQMITVGAHMVTSSKMLYALHAPAAKLNINILKLN